MELSLITNDPEVARAAEDAGIERIMIDLERMGKADRQAGRSLFLSSHTIQDAARIKRVLRRARLTVRVDPPHPALGRQIDQAVDAGADIVMLPYFERFDQAAEFAECVGRRAAPVLLVERVGAVSILPELCSLPGLSEIHVGLNDLSISQGRSHWFDVLATEALDQVLRMLRHSGVPFGFGGIGSLSRRDLPLDPGLVLAEQVFQGATRGWLGRSFREVALAKLAQEVWALRTAIDRWTVASGCEREQTRSALRRQIEAVSLGVRSQNPIPTRNTP